MPSMRGYRRGCRDGISLLPNDSCELAQLWSLRIMQRLLSMPGGSEVHEHLRDEIGPRLGIKVEPGKGKSDATRLRRRTTAVLAARERRAAQIHPPEPLRGNLERIGTLVGLDETARALLCFAVLVRTDPVLDQLLLMLGDLSPTQVPHAYAVILKTPAAAVSAALAPRGALERSGLLSLDDDPIGNCSRFNLLPGRSFIARMMATLNDPLDLLRESVLPAPAPTLGLDDFPHLAPEIALLVPLLREAVEQRRPGVNILFHGPPGTGKSELSRLLAQHVGQRLFEVSSSDGDGDPTTGKERLQSFRVAQALFGSQPALLAFDECEDVLGGGGGGGGAEVLRQLLRGAPPTQSHKGWLNRMLENNEAPTIWISNSVAGIDPAVLRRFDLAVAFGTPPVAQRRRILEQACGSAIAAPTLARLADRADLAPAIVARAASVLERTAAATGAGGAPLGDEDRAAALERIIDGALRAQGRPPLASTAAPAAPEFYSLAFLNCSTDPEVLVAGIGRHGSARILLTGLPGTGKTAFARHLAERIGRPLLARRLSDLLGPYVGMTEQAIAQAFAAAKEQGAVLLLDEIDSLLRDRSQAQRNWEAAMVNETLTQMEAYDGVFLASTNLQGVLDDAALRRFDLVVDFKHLAPAQVWELFLAQCRALGVGEPDAALEPRVARIPLATPGDFAAVARQARFHPLGGPEALLAAVEEACGRKRAVRTRTPGF